MPKAKAAQPDWTIAAASLSAADPIMAAIIARIGPCTLSSRGDHFCALAKAIFSQQLSTTVARVLYERFEKLFPRNKPTAYHALTLDDAAMKSCGLSRQKMAYLRDLATRFDAGAIPSRKLPKMEDEAVIEVLTQVKGVGRWTAEMFLIFVLNRTDVLPVDDLGLQKGVKKAFAMKKHPTLRQIVRRAEAWRPYRSIATWYLWQNLSK